ncbi:glycoside hydrolase family 28 [Fibrella aestuarina BUZ 2]|uniref:Glycoside hydrolase family 28 n=1 Tax=Fibrella aestuarina BUZ 2 TaxID=1166018 RepID=I0KC76_9BACT|nr:glycosyl hydrolase family 28 protein [Fibrella aestuarina]CCH01729.1 glycoside hydrolase family 28 [Fibrella aestuarina BUZ 2]
MKPVFLFLIAGLLVALRPADERVRVFLCGDSTMAPKLPIDVPETGWGMPFADYFTSVVALQNHAVNGRSTKSFITEGRWANVIGQVRPGDWVLIQFGHNDQKSTDSTRYAAPQTTYRQNLTRFVNEVKAKGGNAVLLTPVMRRKFDANGKFVDQHGEYPGVVKAVAKELGVPLIDLHAKSQAVIEQHGPEGSKVLFMHYPPGMFPKHVKGITDDTHFSPYGAALMASLVAQSLVEQGLPLRNFLKGSDFPEKLAFELPKVYQPYFRKDTFNIARYGSKADGITLNTQAINQAITRCSQAGGGTVLIPEGLWLTGPLVLRSNVNLHLASGALLQFSRNRDDYPIVATTWEGQDAYRCQAPIWGVDLVNVAITGSGVIDGGGEVWRAVKKSKQTASQWAKLVASGGVLDDKKETWYPSAGSMKGAQSPDLARIANGKTPAELTEIRDFLRPNMVSLTRCQYVLLDGVTFQNSPAWTLHPLLCEHVTMRGVTVKNQWYAQNGDGVDLESCRNGLLENCTFDTGDDGITIKSGRDEEGRKRGVPTENFIIRDCRVYQAHGGFVIGSEMSGGVRNMYVSNCQFMGTDVGLRFKTARGRGGVVENIYVNNISMTQIAGEAILFDMYYAAKDPVPQAGDKNELPTIEGKPLNEGTPRFRSFFVHNVSCLGAETGILIRGLPEMPVSNILIENAVLQTRKGLVCIEASDIRLKNVSLLATEPTVMQVQNSQQITLDGITYPKTAERLLKISGDRTKGIRLTNTNVPDQKQLVELGNHVPKGALIR